MSSSDAIKPAQPIVCGTYQVKPGDCLSSIAAASGHLWTTIWNHGSNADIKKARDPHILLPGDQVFVPPRQERMEQAATDSRHKYVRKSTPSMLRLVVKDLDEPLAGEHYVLNIDGNTVKGTTDSAGQIEEPIPPKSSKGHLIVGDGDDALEFDFCLGTLDPIDSVTGIQARLINLGYNPGPVDGIAGPRTMGAIEDFCAANNIDPPEDGQITQEFCNQLAQAHGF